MSESLIRLMHAAYVAPADGVTDAELLARMVGGTDSAAFELLIRRHAEMVWSTCRRVARDHQAAEDAFQAAFLALVTRAKAVRGCVAGWLYRVAYHAALKARTRSRRLAPAGLLDDQPATALTPGADADEVGLIVHDELSALPGKYREPLILCYLEGFTQAEAARQLGLPLGTLATRVSRGGQRLRDRLTRRGVAPVVGGVVAMFGPSSRVSAELVVAAARLGMSPAATWPGPIVYLMNGALSAMSIVKTKVVITWVMSFAVAAGGLAVAGGGQPGGAPGGPPVVKSPPPTGPSGSAAGGASGPAPGGGVFTLTNKGVIVGLTPGGSFGPSSRPAEKLGVTLPDRVASAGQRIRSLNNLKQILLAMHSFHDANGYWPNGIKSEQGQLLLSWRVQILPYLNQDALYRKFNLDEPWDDPTNKPLLAQMPEVFKVGIEPAGSTDTYYQMFCGIGTMCDHSQRVTMVDIPDGTSNTLAVAEIGPPVPWTKPVDVAYSIRKPLPELAPPFKNIWNVGMGDGSVRALRPVIDPINLRRLVERADGEVIDLDKLSAPAIPVTEKEKKDALALREEVVQLKAKRDDLIRRREVARAEAEAAKQGAAGAEVHALEREKQQLLIEMQRIQDEIEVLKHAAEAAKATPKK